MSATFQPKCCTRCGSTFQPTGSAAKFCPECRPEAVRERVRRNVAAWRKADPERDREARRKWRVGRKLRDAQA